MLAVNINITLCGAILDTLFYSETLKEKEELYEELLFLSEGYRNYFNRIKYLEQHGFFAYSSLSW